MGLVGGVEAAREAGDGGAVGEDVEAVGDFFEGGAGVGEELLFVVGEELGQVGAGGEGEAVGVPGEVGGVGRDDAGEVEEAQGVGVRG